MKVNFVELIVFVYNLCCHVDLTYNGWMVFYWIPIVLDECFIYMRTLWLQEILSNQSMQGLQQHKYLRYAQFVLLDHA